MRMCANGHAPVVYDDRLGYGRIPDCPACEMRDQRDDARRDADSAAQRTDFAEQRAADLARRLAEATSREKREVRFDN